MVLEGRKKKEEQEVQNTRTIKTGGKVCKGKSCLFQEYE